MTTFGVTNEGFVLKRLADILTDMQTSLSGITDPITGETLTINLQNENDPLVLLVNAFADELSVAWEQLQICYNQFDPAKATGAGLKGLVQLNGLRWRQGTPTTANVLCTGTPLSTVSSGQLVGNQSNTITLILPEFTFDSDGEAQVLATATENGELIAVAGDINQILTPLSNWYSVINPSNGSPGTADEVDTSLRGRQRLSTSATGSKNIDSLQGALSNILGVTYCKVYQNKLMVTNSIGIPAKQIAVVIKGGNPQEIANTIFPQIPFCGDTFGTSTVTLVDVNGIPSPINYSIPEELNIYVSINIHVFNSTLFPDDGVNLIKEAIVGFSQSGASAVGISSGFDQDGYQPGDSVYASELYVPINSIQGFKIISVFIATTTSPTSGDEVQVPWNKVANFLPGNITVTES